MAQSTDSILLSSIRDVAQTNDSVIQLDCLLRIKNTIFGHSLWKEMAVENGLVPVLERILSATSSEKVNTSMDDQSSGLPGRSNYDELRLQAILIVDTLGNKRASIAAPIMHSNIPGHLLDCMAIDNTPIEISIYALRALNTLLTSMTLLSMQLDVKDNTSSFALQFFTPRINGRLKELLLRPIMTEDQRRMVSEAIKLLGLACDNQTSRAAAVDTGLMNILVDSLTDAALIETRHNLKHGEASKKGALLICTMIDALINITRNSHYRIWHMIMRPKLRRTFISEGLSNLWSTNTVPDSRDVQLSRLRQGLLENRILSAVLIPNIPFDTTKSSPASPNPTTKMSRHTTFDAHSEPFCSWLIYFARSLETPSAQESPLALLAAINCSFDKIMRTGEITKSYSLRESQLKMLVIPLIEKLVQEMANENHWKEMLTTLQYPNKSACRTLATLIEGNSKLQQTAYDAGVLKHIITILRKTFEPISISQPMWSSKDREWASEMGTDVTSLQYPDLPIEVSNLMTIRADALSALAAISNNETYRKPVVEKGALPLIVNSLQPITQTSLSNLTSSRKVCTFNTRKVLIAACTAAQTISRSVAMLRTSLLDVSIVEPVLNLVDHANILVQIAATNVISNLLYEPSALRQDLIDGGIIKRLCSHAKSSVYKLREASLCALKQVVNNASVDLKRQILNDVGPAWLMSQLTDTSKVELLAGSTNTMSDTNPAGQKIDILNVSNDVEMDIDATHDKAANCGDTENGARMDTDEQNGKNDDDDNENDNDNYDNDDDDDNDNDNDQDSLGTNFKLSDLRTTAGKTRPISKWLLENLQNRESNPLMTAKLEGDEIQRQILDIFRNFVMDQDGASADLIDSLAKSVGGIQTIFDATLLILKVQHRFDQRTVAIALQHPKQQVRQSPTDDLNWKCDSVILSAIMLVVHIAAGSSAIKQILSQQTDLFRALLHYFSHPNWQIRDACIWVVINLTWLEDQSDRDNARLRALELRTTGIEEKIRSLKDDPRMNVKERVKTAIKYMDEVLGALGPVQHGRFAH